MRACVCVCVCVIIPNQIVCNYPCKNNLTLPTM